MKENGYIALDQAEYEERYNSLTKRYGAIENRLEGINEKRLERSAKRENIEEFIKILEKSSIILILKYTICIYCKSTINTLSFYCTIQANTWW
ncbi:MULTISPECIES: hypothetical protein [Clostridium]|uniref:Uncharacterized protein n=1 Tax=Clostridium ragsdalei P11 TaxID=1353534 RepID=A0A1A6AVP8_9CLOT|nr:MULTISPECIES: hypothetical protein [Clostridium]OBR94159.1 hypothetical protein CLRAG_16990 [Clostridium ragsdalei P11]QXE20947.1 hypothetical protein B5S50_19990 [Clostridium sp. 001]